MSYKVKVTKEKELEFATKKETLERIDYWRYGSFLTFILTMIAFIVAWVTYDYRALVVALLGILVTIFYYSHYQTDRILARMEWKEK